MGKSPDVGPVVMRWVQGCLCSGGLRAALIRCLCACGQGGGEAGEVELCGLVLGEFEQYDGLEVGDVPTDGGGVQRVLDLETIKLPAWRELPTRPRQSHLDSSGAASIPARRSLGLDRKSTLRAQTQRHDG
jgi:hypothetical protein